MCDSDRTVSDTGYCTLSFEPSLSDFFPSFSDGPCSQRLSAGLGFCLMHLKKPKMCHVLDQPSEGSSFCDRNVGLKIGGIMAN